jgi:hypothetical protein
MILAACQMLDYLAMADKAANIRGALKEVIAKGEHTTGDLGGSASTTEFTEAVIVALYGPATTMRHSGGVLCGSTLAQATLSGRCATIHLGRGR